MSDEIGPEFFRRTRHTRLGPSDQQLDLPQPPLEVPPDPDAPCLDLPTPSLDHVAATDLTDALVRRVSVRQYADKALTLDELAHLLWCTQGVKSTLDQYATMRTVPSAGARHALETYLLINRVDGLEAGLYRYLALSHRLQRIRDEDGSALAAQLTQACFNQRMVFDSAVTFVWVAAVYRMTWRYGQRGYRYLLLDAGHVCQNLYLAAEAIDCGVCAIAAFDDEHLDALLQLDGQTQFALYVATVGKKPR